jgi:hypothetical protein
MTMAINALLTELTEEEGSSVQGGNFFFNFPFFSPSTATGAPASNSLAAQRDPLNYGFTAFAFNFVPASGVPATTGFVQSIPGTTAPVSPVGLNPLLPNAGLFQILFR